jgi:zinc protease
MKYLRPSLAFALMLPMLATAESLPKPKLQVDVTSKPYDVKMKDFNFPSGLRVIFQEDHAQPIISISYTNDRGSQADQPGREGIAHLIEHLWFRSQHIGSDGKRLPKVWDLYEEMGASLNAFTSNDITDYTTILPREHIDAALRLESLRMREPVAGVEDDVLLVEREVVRNELRQNWENGFGPAFGYIMDRLYPKEHPYARMTIGTHDSLNAITMDDIRDYAKKNYGPALTTIYIAGDFSLADSNRFLGNFGLDQLAAPDDPKGEHIALVEQPTVRVVGPAPEPPAPAAPVEVKGQIQPIPRIKGGVEKPAVAIAWTLPAGYRPESVTANAAVRLVEIAIWVELNGYDFRTDKEPTDVGCFNDPGFYGTTAMCYAEIGDVADAEKVAGKMLDGLYQAWWEEESEIGRQLVTQNFEYSKQITMAYLLNTVDVVSDLFGGRSAQFGINAHYTGDARYFSKSITEINKLLEPKSARQFAEKYLNRKRAVAVAIEPYDKGDITVDSSDSGYKGAKRDDQISSILTEESLTDERIAAAFRVPDVAAIHETRLANGMKLVVYPYTVAPVARMQLVFGGGTESLPWGLHAFAPTMYRNDSYGPVKALAIAGFEDFFMDPLSTSLTLSGAAGNVRDMAYILRTRLDSLIPYTDGKIDWAKSGKKNILDWMKRPEDGSNGQGWASHVMKQRLWPNHRMGKWLTHKDYDELAKLGPQPVGDVYATLLRPENATLYVVGNVTDAEVQEAVNTYFGGWSGWRKKPANAQPIKRTFDPPGELPNRQVILLDKEEVSTSYVNYACQMPAVTADNYAVMRVMADVLDKGTWLALREQTGASYGAYAGLSISPGGPSSLRMFTPVQNDSAALAVQSFIELGEKAKAGNLDTKLIALRKYNIAQSWGLYTQSTEQMLDHITFWADYTGFGFDFFRSLPKSLARVRLADIPAVMDRCVGHEVVTVVGPVAVTQPMIEKLGFKTEVFDWKQARKDYKAQMGLKPEKEEDKKKEKAG